MGLSISLLENCCETCGRSDEVFEANITHNLADMARAAKVYNCIWRHEEHVFTKAIELVPYLEAGIAMLEGNPESFKVFNPPNNWGSYEHLLAFVKKYLEACRSFPGASIKAYR